MAAADAAAFLDAHEWSWQLSDPIRSGPGPGRCPRLDPAAGFRPPIMESGEDLAEALAHATERPVGRLPEDVGVVSLCSTATDQPRKTPQMTL